MSRNIWVKITSYEFLTKVLVESLRTLVAVGISIIIFHQFFHGANQIAVIDLKKIVQEEKQRAVSLKTEEEASQSVALFFSHLSFVIQNRKEVVLVKEAVLNTENVKDITEEVLQLTRKNANISVESAGSSERQK